MNQPLASILLVLPLAVAVPAQDEAAEAFPNPKTPHHERMAALVGTWKTEATMPAMPGVPGMEKPTEAVAIETAELICDGLWLKVSGEGEMAGQPSSGIWMLGYDAIAEEYQCLAVSNMQESILTMAASYDEETSTWSFRGDTPMGPMRSEFTLESADRSVEVCYAAGADGKEVECMRIVRTRMEGDAPAETSAEPTTAEPEVEEASATKPPAARAALLAEVGDWDATFKMEMPGAPAMVSQCRETVRPVCGGGFTWSDFRGEVMGMPFEGHALIGYDSAEDQVTCFWIDSMSGAAMRTDGSYDAERNVFTMRGTSYDEQGEQAPVSSTTTTTAAGGRRMRMVFGEGETQSVMTIDYRRAK